MAKANLVAIENVLPENLRKITSTGRTPDLQPLQLLSRTTVEIDMSNQSNQTAAREVSERRFRGAHPFKLGLFSFNTGGGLTHTLAPERWEASWENCRDLAVRADGAGLDFMLPLGRWIGYGGDTNHNG